MSCLIFLFEAGSKLFYAEQDVGRDVEKDAKPPRRGRYGVAGESIRAMRIPCRGRPKCNARTEWSRSDDIYSRTQKRVRSDSDPASLRRGLLLQKARRRARFLEWICVMLLCGFSRAFVLPRCRMFSRFLTENGV